MCFGFTGSNSAGDGCYINNDGYREMCSYDVVNYDVCDYSTGTSTPPSPDGTCEAGAVWGHSVDNVLSTTTESSVRDCFLKCLFDPSCR